MKSLEKRGHLLFGVGEQFLGVALSENKNLQVFIRFPREASHGGDSVENKPDEKRRENMLSSSI